MPLSAAQPAAAPGESSRGRPTCSPFPTSSFLGTVYTFSLDHLLGTREKSPQAPCTPPAPRHVRAHS